MAYSGGNAATNVGSNRSKIAAACLRTFRTADNSDAGRNACTFDRLSPQASFSAISRKYLRALTGPRTASIASTWARNRTSSALGGGSSVGGDAGYWDIRISGYASPFRRLNERGFRRAFGAGA